MPEAPPSPSNRWSVIAAYALVGAGTQVVWLTYAPVTTVAADRFDVSETAVGWLANLFPLLYVLLAIPAGLLLDRWFRPALAAGALLTAGGAALRLVDDTFVWALIGQTVGAVAQPLVLNAVTGVTSRYLRERDRPAGIAVGTASIFGGMALAFVLGAVVSSEEQLTLLVAIGTVVAAVAALVLVVALRRPEPQPGAVTTMGRAALRAAAGDPFVRRLCLAVLCPFGAFVALTTFGQPLLEPAGVSAEAASVMLLLTVLAGMAGCAVVPVLAARHAAELATLRAGLVAAAAACVVLALAPGVVTGLVALTLFGAALLPALPIVLELVERRTGEAEGTAAGLIWMAGNLGGLVVAVLVGALVDVPGVAFAVCAGVVLVAVPLVALLRPGVAELEQEVGAGVG
jgi:predicted MFS family arabinose efflux permease